MVKELLDRLEVEQVVRYRGGYLLYTKVSGTYTKFNFLLKNQRVQGYSGNQWVELTEQTQEFIRDKVKRYYRGLCSGNINN
ncbi:MAG: hypothetical protein KAJ79_02220 [Candidatus Omnitrophica bacterium]|nr:hypothetical protein [Candidatus Omnitrophota bacterium]